MSSNYSMGERKQRMSTLTTQAGLSHARRMKIAQFKTINHPSTQKLDTSLDKKSLQNKKIPNKTEQIPQSRRYSQAGSLRSHHESLNLKQRSIDKSLNKSLNKSIDKSLGNRTTQIQSQSHDKIGNRLRIRSQHLLNQNRRPMPYIMKQPARVEDGVVVEEELSYLEQLQKEKNRRIQDIYNPVGKVMQAFNNKSISLLRKNKNKPISYNKFGSGLIQSLKKVEKSKEQRSQLSSNSRDKSIKSKNSIKKLDFSSTKKKQLTTTIDSHSPVPKILPVTFQRIEQLSTIKESNQIIQKANQHQLQLQLQQLQQQKQKQLKQKQQKEQKQKQKQKQKQQQQQQLQLQQKQKQKQHQLQLQLQLLQQEQQEQQRKQKYQYKPKTQARCQKIPSVLQRSNTLNHDNSLLQDGFSVTSKVRASTADDGLPFPKFNNFLDSYQRDPMNTSQTKTYLFKQLQGDKGEQASNSGQSRFNTETVLKKQNISQLSIYKDLDKATLKVIKSKDAVYYGEIDENGLKHGKGAFFYHSGKVYEGDFKNDIKEGHGVQQHPDGSIYIGQFKAGCRNGKGRFEWHNGEIYDGQWLDNLKHGSGIWESKDKKASYIGEWSAGEISGFGVLTNEKGERYEGEFKKFIKEGHGAYRFENGDRIIGNFKRNQPNGQCEYFWANGDYYKGNFTNGLRYGKGLIKYVDGSYFEGQFRNDKKCGLGREFYSDQIVYYGNYENDLRHGYGKLQYNEQIYYEGYWLNNVAVVFKQNSALPPEITEDDKQRLASVLSNNNLNSKKLEKLQMKDREKILKSLLKKSPSKSSKLQRFSSKNLFERLCQPKRPCQCCALKYSHVA